MRTFDETVTLLGAPLSRAVLDGWSGRKIVVARWRYNDVVLKKSAEDAFRIVMTLGCEHTVRYKQVDFAASLRSVAGDVRVFPPIDSFEAIVEGQADTLQIFIEAGACDSLAARGATKRPLLDVTSEDLRASALALFMTGRSHGAARAAAMLRDSVRQLIASHAAGAQFFQGGLRPATMHRIDGLIDTSLDAKNGLEAKHATQPSVGDLAREARLSVSHFIRAFSQTTGTTPYQYIMARRRKRALGLLGQPRTSVAEVADGLGFSSPAHFVASFRRRFGTTPGDYRQALLDPQMLGRRSLC